MTLKRYFTLMIICTLINWAIWVLVIFFVNPEKIGLIGSILFYLSLFLSLLGTSSLLFFILGVRLKKRPIFVEISWSFRRAFLFSLFVVVILLLKEQGVLYWWTAILLALFLIMLEIFFSSVSRKYFSESQENKIEHESQK